MVTKTIRGFLVSMALLALPNIRYSIAMQTNRLREKAALSMSGKYKMLSPPAHRESSSIEKCAVLTNHDDIFSTVQVEVGTPPQTFDVVADTGSNNVIIPSCLCEEKGSCHTHGICFTGNETSSTFHPSMDKAQNETARTVLRFGSGDISTLIGTDVVRVGAEEANMTDGLLLMVDTDIDIPIEGILGLGPPRKRTSDLYDTADRSWLKFAGVSKFSVCFNAGDDGVLRLDSHMAHHTFQSVGQDHWALDFRGISVGDRKAPALFCNASDMHEGQLTPCAGIPDSGTTMIVGPVKHLASLFESICDSWDRCTQAAAENSETPKFAILQQILLACEDWLDESHGLDELPDLHFHIGVHNRSLRIPPHGYVLRTDPKDLQLMNRTLVGAEFLQTGASKPQKKEEDSEVCIPAFSQMEYETQLNGPIFIFGSAFFYNWQVGYDLHGGTISFKDEPCGSCDEKTKLASSKAEVNSGSAGKRNNWPRKVRGERLPLIDIKKPL